MKSNYVSKLVRVSVLALILASISSAVPTLAQSTENSSSQTSGSSTQSTTSKTTTVEVSKPVQTTTKTVTSVDPVWLVAGGVGLIALLAIIALAMRGRSRDTVTTAVHERETVINK